MTPLAWGYKWLISKGLYGWDDTYWQRPAANSPGYRGLSTQALGMRSRLVATVAPTYKGHLMLDDAVGALYRRALAALRISGGCRELYHDRGGTGPTQSK
jgi:hypothetical protein